MYPQEPKFPLNAQRLKSIAQAWGFNTNKNITVSHAVAIISPGHHAILKKGANTKAKLSGWRWVIYEDKNPIMIANVKVGFLDAVKFEIQENKTHFTHQQSQEDNAGILIDPNTQEETPILYQENHWTTKDKKTIAPVLNKMKNED